MKITDWHGCYDGGWKDLIVPEAFAHPAKFSYALIQRIFAHGLERGYWKPGDTVADPFGGVALGGIMAGYAGLNWIGVELEPRFVELGNKNLALHGPKWMRLGQANVVKLVQGDSRRFAEIVGACGAVVSSPPFVDSMSNAPSDQILAGSGGRMGASCKGDNYGTTPGQIGRLPAGDLAGVVSSPPFTKQSHHGGDTPTAKGIGRNTREQRPTEAEGNHNLTRTYGAAEGQIDELPTGDLAGVITSPPYAQSVHEGNGIDQSKLTGNKPGANTQAKAEGYGQTTGNIGNLAAGELAGVVTSPPWEKCDQRGSMESKVALHAAAVRDGRGHKGKLGPSVGNDYGDDPGQIGNDSGETYWQAVAQVYAQCRLAIKPGGVMALVVKDYVKNKARVPLCDQTAELLARLGFVVFERCRCWLVKEREHTCLFDGKVTTRKERKSFFRRLAEKKGSPRIDFEEVIWATSAEQ
jgi:hypothetical protein